MSNSKCKKIQNELDNEESYVGSEAFLICAGILLVMTTIFMFMGLGVLTGALLFLFAIVIILSWRIEKYYDDVNAEYLKYKKAYESEEFEGLELPENKEGIYAKSKKYYAVYKWIAILTFITVFLVYIVIAIMGTNMGADNIAILGKPQNIATCAVSVSIGVILCLSNAMFKNDCIRRAEFMRNCYIDLCVAAKKRNEIINS